MSHVEKMFLKYVLNPHDEWDKDLGNISKSK